MLVSKIKFIVLVYYTNMILLMYYSVIYSYCTSTNHQNAHYPAPFVLSHLVILHISSLTVC